MTRNATLTQAPRRSLVDSAIEQIRTQIESGAWRVGERIAWCAGGTAAQDTPSQVAAIPMPECAGVGTAYPTFGSLGSVFRRIPAAQGDRRLDTAGMFNPAQEMATCPTPC